MKNWIVRVYDKNDKELEVYVIKDRTEHEANSEAMGDYARTVGATDYSVTELEPLVIGEHFGSQCGIYINKYIQELALEYGWPRDKAVLDMDHDDFLEASEEAEEYLSDFVPEGYVAEYWEGNWGVYSIADLYDEPDWDSKVVFDDDDI